MEKMEKIRHDPIVENIVKKFRDRSHIGIQKYGTTLYESTSDVPTWIQHAQEELMDAILYLEKLKTMVYRSKL